MAKNMQINNNELKHDTLCVECKEPRWWKWVFIGLMATFSFTLLLMSLDAGNSGDEDFWQYPHAERIYNYYTTFGSDTTYRSVPEMNAYGMWFEVLGVAIIKTFNIDNYQKTRHLMNALMGAIAILFAGLFAKNCSRSWRTGAIVLILLFISPRFLGHSFNNPKDIPFATMFMVALYYIHKFILEYPNFSIKTSIKLALALALAVGIRAGGLLLYAYFVMYIACFYLFTNKPRDYFSKNNRKVLKRLLLHFSGIVVGAFLITILIWPYIMSNPIGNTIKAFTELSHYQVGIRQLFEGSLQWSDALPWYYTPKFILMTIPIAVIIGLILFIILIWKDKNNFINYFIVFFSFFFPIFWIIYTNANVYGGWRHSLFVYPPMVVAAGLGFNLAINWVSRKSTKITLINICTIIVLLLLLWNPIRHIVNNHPYQYVYFNEWVGGVSKAYGNYEMDYYYNSTREAAEWLLKNNDIAVDENSKIKVASWHPASVNYFLRNDTANFRTVFSRWHERGNNDWDYAIFTITGMMPEEIKNSAFPPKNTVYQIKVDDKPICIVLKRETKDDLLGFQLKNNKDYFSAIQHFKKALEIDTTNISISINLVECYFNTGKLDSAKLFIDKFLEYAPENETVNYFLAHFHNFSGETEKALKVLKKIRDYNNKFKAAYHLAFQIYAKQNDLKNAEKVMLELLNTDQLDEQSFNQLLSLYKAQGLDERGAYKKIYKKQINAFEKIGKRKEAQLYRDALKKI